MSGPIDYSKYQYRSVVVDLVSGVLDSLGLERAHLVGASIGNLWALRFAEHRPDRVEKIVLIGGGPNREIPVPTFIKLLASPIGNVIVRLPMRQKMMQSQLRAIGHGPSLDQGRMGDFVDWRLTFVNNTASMRHERAMIKALLDGGAFRSGVTFGEAELKEVDRPTLMIFGTADPTGTVDVWKRFVGQLPRGELRSLDGKGHMPWWDDPSAVGDEVNPFLKGS